MLHGLATVKTRTSGPAALVDRLALAGEDRAVGADQVGARLIPPSAAGRRPGSPSRLPSNASSGLSVAIASAQEREGAVLQLHHGAAQGRQRRRDLEQLKRHRLIGPERGPRGDSEEQGVPDLARRPR